MVDGTRKLEQHDPPATEQVHFCRTYIRPPMPKDESDLLEEYDRSHPAAQGVVKTFIFLFLVVLVYGLTRLFTIPPVIGISVGCIVFVALSLHSVIAPWRFNRRLERERVRDIPPAGSRLQCVGAPSDLPQVHELQSVMFEPQVRRASIASLLVMQGMAMLGLMPLIGNFGLRDGNIGWGTLASLCFVVALLSFWLRPLYFRVSPGRLEVLRYGFLKRTPDEVERYDLRRAYIVADLRRNRLSVSESDKNGKNYSLMWMPQRREFLTTLFMAAVSEYAAPELPLDTL